MKLCEVTKKKKSEFQLFFPIVAFFFFFFLVSEFASGTSGSLAEGSICGLASRTPRIKVTRACVSALARWRDPFWLKRGVTLDTAHRRKVVTTYASNKGWGEGKPTFSLWYEEESGLHINCLEMLAVCQACQFFLPDIRGHHVLVRSDSRSVVS